MFHFQYVLLAQLIICAIIDIVNGARTDVVFKNPDEYDKLSFRQMKCLLMVLHGSWPCTGDIFGRDRELPYKIFKQLTGCDPEYELTYLAWDPVYIIRRFHCPMLLFAERIYTKILKSSEAEKYFTILADAKKEIEEGLETVNIKKDRENCKGTMEENINKLEDEKDRLRLTNIIHIVEQLIDWNRNPWNEIISRVESTLERCASIYSFRVKEKCFKEFGNLMKMLGKAGVLGEEFDAKTAYEYLELEMTKQIEIMDELYQMYGSEKRLVSSKAKKFPRKFFKQSINEQKRQHLKDFEKTTLESAAYDNFVETCKKMQKHCEKMAKEYKINPSID